VNSSQVSVALERVTRYFGTRARRRRAVRDVSVTFREGDRVAIVGESGSGKSTLARMAVGLDFPSDGYVTFNGERVDQILRSRSQREDFRRTVQYIGQDTTSSFDPARTLLDSVTQPLIRLRGLSRSSARDSAYETLLALGLTPDLALRRARQVSGGQRQRFAIARALVLQPRVLVCDEVVSALDVSVQGEILNMLKKYALDNGAGLVFVSHGLPAAGFIAADVLVMSNGAIVERGPTADVFAQPQHPYTSTLLAAHGKSSRIAAEPG
jgi:peptide/nickel transport system ATP-binding protein